MLTSCYRWDSDGQQNRHYNTTIHASDLVNTGTGPTNTTLNITPMTTK
jgi:hypothetical protein